jgi:hypothetical protein
MGVKLAGFLSRLPDYCVINFFYRYLQLTVTENLQPGA